ncbi:AAA domain protein [Treponema socranskii subsp. socranskii VPI DR56BR1116 = ATCC 35536]|uniref:AAA domain protein n=2 Tax=Treponema socranskii TaxID=53419 RepID=U1F9L7_TRESO|nr:AAA domain protein [Treponema socranskii subsp. socranskii VPI DR56BR1116 = ATCC 35536]ERK03493.1 AAA domain protein [Treponema socranskii subsp. socranskii VPI DR56BR1116 = ATCC 35536]
MTADEPKNFPRFFPYTNPSKYVILTLRIVSVCTIKGHYMMDIKIITVSRQFGSGGRIIAKDVADKLGWKFYDREIIEKIAEKSGLAKEFIEERGEYASAGQNLVYSAPAGFGGFSTGQSVFDKLYVMQYNIIREIAEEGPCVIVGRCADYVLRDRTDCFHVFIYADMDFRIARAGSIYKVDAPNIERYLLDRDKKRKLYYKYNTDRVWGDVKNYDLCLKSSAIGLDTCAAMICDAAQHKTVGPVRRSIDAAEKAVTAAAKKIATGLKKSPAAATTKKIADEVKKTAPETVRKITANVKKSAPKAEKKAAEAAKKIASGVKKAVSSSAKRTANRNSDGQ